MTQEVSDELPQADLLRMTTQVVAAYVGHNSVAEAQISDLIKFVYASLAGLNEHTGLATDANQKPAVPIKKSITADYLICLEDGKKFKMLKRHLRTEYGLSPEDSLPTQKTWFPVPPCETVSDNVSVNAVSP